MFRNKTRILAAVAPLAALTATASAQPPRHQRSPVVEQYARERPPLTVTKRSYLDPANIAPAGKTAPNYVLMGTVLNLTSDKVFNTSAFGNDRLPRRFEVPGRPSPVVEFATPAYPYWP